MDVNSLWPFQLRRGASKNPRDGACLLDAVSWFEYGCLGDHPPCVSPVLAMIGQAANDWSEADDRQALRRFIPLLPGTIDLAADVMRVEYLEFSWARLARQWEPYAARGGWSGAPLSSLPPWERVGRPEYHCREILSAASMAWKGGRSSQRYEPMALPTVYSLDTTGPEPRPEARILCLSEDVAQFARSALEVCAAIGKRDVEWDFSKAPERVREFEEARV